MSGTNWKDKEGDKVTQKDLASLEEKIAKLEEANKKLEKSNEDLQVSNEVLQLSATKTKQEVTLEKYAKYFDDDKIVKAFQDDETMKFEDALISLLDTAHDYCKNIKASFKKTSPKKAGAVSNDDLDDTEPENIEEAVKLIKASNPDLKGSEVYKLVRQTYTHLYPGGNK